MARWLAIAGLIGIFVAIAGCLTAEQQRRVDELAGKNDTLALEIHDLLRKAKEGKATTGEVADAVGKLKAAMDSNLEEIKAIQASGGVWATVMGLVGLFGRTAAHGLGAIPTTNPILMAIQGFLTLLLGGSSTVKPKVVQS